MWEEKDNRLSAELEFADFRAAFRFMTIVAALAEEQQHHPDWHNVYNRVTINLTTHDAGNTVTDKDRNLAAMIESHPEVRTLLGLDA